MPAILTHQRAYTPPAEGTFTASDLLCHPEWGPCELIRGKVVPVCRPNNKHGRLVVSLGGKLDAFVESRKLGMVFSESGVLLERDPDTLRGPDFHFVRGENCPSGTEFDGYLNLPPDLCVEIVSPSDSSADLLEKVEQYLHFGVKLVWVIDPDIREARLYRLDGSTEIIGPGGQLTGEDILPGFSISLADLFAVLEPRVFRK